MSHLWTKQADGEWAVHPLEVDLVQLEGTTPHPIGHGQLAAVTAPVIARSATDRGVERWTLLCARAQRVRVNGTLVTVGIRTLADRDAISLAHGRGRRTWFLSLERIAEVVPFPGDTHDTYCIRCKLPIRAQTEAVRCPGHGCGFWHHQSAKRPCWTYTDGGCANCGHPTDFEAGLQWTPDAL